MWRRVEGFAGTTSAHHGLHALQLGHGRAAEAGKQANHRGHNLLGRRQPPLAEIPTGQSALGRLEHVYAPAAQERHIVLYRR